MRVVRLWEFISKARWFGRMWASGRTAGSSSSSERLVSLEIGLGRWVSSYFISLTLIPSLAFEGYVRPVRLFDGIAAVPPVYFPIFSGSLFNIPLKVLLVPSFGATAL